MILDRTLADSRAWLKAVEYSASMAKVLKRKTNKGVISRVYAIGMIKLPWLIYEHAGTYRCR